MTAQASTVLNMRMRDDDVVELLDVVITYESALRGLSRGQAVYELIMTAANVESYPEPVKARIEEAQRDRRERALRESLAVPRRSSGKVA